MTVKNSFNLIFYLMKKNNSPIVSIQKIFWAIAQPFRNDKEQLDKTLEINDQIILNLNRENSQKIIIKSIEEINELEIGENFKDKNSASTNKLSHMLKYKEPLNEENEHTYREKSYEKKENNVNKISKKDFNIYKEEKVKDHKFKKINLITILKEKSNLVNKINKKDLNFYKEEIKKNDKYQKINLVNIVKETANMEKAKKKLISKENIQKSDVENENTLKKNVSLPTLKKKKKTEDVKSIKNEINEVPIKLKENILETSENKSSKLKLFNAPYLTVKKTPLDANFKKMKSVPISSFKIQDLKNDKKNPKKNVGVEKNHFSSTLLSTDGNVDFSGIFNFNSFKNKNRIIETNICEICGGYVKPSNIWESTSRQGKIKCRCDDNHPVKLNWSRQSLNILYKTLETPRKSASSHSPPTENILGIQGLTDSEKKLQLAIKRNKGVKSIFLENNPVNILSPFVISITKTNSI